MYSKKRNKKAGVLYLLIILVAVSLQGCKDTEAIGEIPEVTATPGNVAGQGEPTEVPEHMLPTGEPSGEDDEKQPEEHPELPKFTHTMGNELYFEFAYPFKDLAYRSENPDVVQAKFMEGEYDWEENREITGVMLYGIANGETELVVFDVNSGQEVRWTVTVKKPKAESGKQVLIDWLLANGEINDLGDKVLTKGTPESGGQATVEYAAMDKNINFYFIDKQGEEKLEWNLIPTASKNTEYHITMRMGEDFVTATIDLATYDGETLVFEKGWFRVPVEEDMQKKANEVSGHAFEAVKTLLYEETGMTMGEVVR